MYLGRVKYQMSYRMKSVLPCFHKAHLENLILLVVGMAYARSVCLPQAASAAFVKEIQLDSRVARFARLLRCEKVVSLEVLRPLAYPARLQQLVVAVTFASWWLMQIGSEVVNRGWWRQVANRAATHSVSLCQIGLGLVT